MKTHIKRLLRLKDVGQINTSMSKLESLEEIDDTFYKIFKIT